MSIVQSGLPLALSMPFILAAWIALMHRQRATTSQGNTPYAAVENGSADPVDTGFAVAALDLEAALREAMVAVNSTARTRWVRLELAVGGATSVRVDPSALRTALRDTMLIAIGAAPGGQLLVTALMLGSQLHIRITDDGPGNDQQVREMSMRQTQALIALQGGSIAVEARPGRGTTVTIRLPVPAAVDQDASGLMQLDVFADQAA
jgi:signal transduction histidine kinase